jgi:hypothetical protein
MASLNDPLKLAFGAGVQFGERTPPRQETPSESFGPAIRKPLQIVVSRVDNLFKDGIGREGCPRGNSAFRGRAIAKNGPEGRGAVEGECLTTDGHG